MHEIGARHGRPAPGVRRHGVDVSCPFENSEQKGVQYLKNMRCVRRVGKNNRSMASELFQNVFGAMGRAIVTE
jgi:hypothetical protein